MRTSGSRRDAARRVHAQLRLAHQRAHVRRAGAPRVGDEVRVHRRDLRAPHAMALEPDRLDQAARVVAGRVLEDRAAGRHGERLRRARGARAGARSRPRTAAGVAGVTRSSAETSARARREPAQRAVDEAQRPGRQVAQPRAGRAHHLELDQHVAELAARARPRSSRSSRRPCRGCPARELEPREPALRAEARDLAVRDAGLDAQQRRPAAPRCARKRESCDHHAVERGRRARAC